MVNSSWTSGHIKNITGDNKNVKIVYPPCNTKSMEEFELKNRKKIILCVAQFRPEKAHSVQLDAFSQFISKTNHKDTQLVLVGSARNNDDHKRVVALESQARELKIEDSVKFVVNASYDEVLHWLSISSIGINTMIDEHFGINVVEYMVRLFLKKVVLILMFNFIGRWINSSCTCFGRSFIGYYIKV